MYRWYIVTKRLCSAPAALYPVATGARVDIRPAMASQNNLEAPAMVQIAEQNSDPFKENISPERAKGACVLLDLSTAEPDPSGWYASDAPRQTHEASFWLGSSKLNGVMLSSSLVDVRRPLPIWHPRAGRPHQMKMAAWRSSKKKPKKHGKRKTAKKSRSRTSNDI